MNEQAVLPTVITEDFLTILRQHGVKSAALFGSQARGNARVDSDIDLFVNFNQAVSLFNQISLADELAKVSGRRVDVVSKINPVFAPYIEPSLIPLPV